MKGYPKYKTPVFSAIAVALSVSVTGCASWFHDDEQREEIRQEREEILQELEQQRERESNRRQFEASDAWIGGGVVKDKKQYPELESTPIALSMRDATLADMADRVGDLSGVRIRLTSDVHRSPEDDDDEQADEQGSQDATGQTFGPGNILEGENLDELLGRSGPQADIDAERSLRVDGSLVDALDRMASIYDLSWRYNGRDAEVEFFRTESKNFQVYFSGENSQEIALGQTDTSDAVISEETSYQNESGTWEEIEEGVEGMLSTWGSANLHRATGTVTVRDTPDNLKVISQYVRELNEVFGNQVYLEFEVISVTMNSEQSFQASWDNILNTVVGGDYSAGVDTGTNVIAGQGNALNVIRNDDQASAALQLLATEADLSEVTSHSVTTATNQPAPIRVVQDTSYIESVSLNQDVSSGSGGGTGDSVISDIETDTINSGFSVTLVPRVQNSNRLQLQISMELSTLLSLDTVEDTIIQTPELDRRALVQRAWLNSGETMVMSGFTSDRDEVNEQGSGTSSFWGLGGGRSSQSGQQVLLIMITPHIQSGVHSG